MEIIGDVNNVVAFLTFIVTVAVLIVGFHLNQNHRDHVNEVKKSNRELAEIKTVIEKMAEKSESNKIRMQLALRTLNSVSSIQRQLTAARIKHDESAGIEKSTVQLIESELRLIGQKSRRRQLEITYLASAFDGDRKSVLDQLALSKPDKETLDFLHHLKVSTLEKSELEWIHQAIGACSLSARIQ